MKLQLSGSISYTKNGKRGTDTAIQKMVSPSTRKFLSVNVGAPVAAAKRGGQAASQLGVRCLASHPDYQDYMHEVDSAMAVVVTTGGRSPNTRIPASQLRSRSLPVITDDMGCGSPA
jgi:hypothetical protein